jgi:outer membrane murein-binding lipoprotein Lpp
LKRKNNMKKVMKLSMVALVASLAVGCASTSDLDALSARVDGLDAKVAQASADAASAKSAADDAAAAARSAAQSAQDTNSKLDNMFKKTMMK